LKRHLTKYRKEQKDKMFGGLYPDGTATAGPELLSDLTLEKIDYDWIKT